MKIASITAGGAGMFCGSCLQDNTIARALLRLGHEVTLIPTYTPLTLDEESPAMDRVFIGGINVYLDHYVPGWRWVPRGLTRWLDRPGLINALTRRAISNDGADLGPLTLSMLRGPTGPHRHLFDELARFVAEELRPDAVIFTNALLMGALPALRQRFRGPIVCMVQGDDYFVESLPAASRDAVIYSLRTGILQFDRCIVHSRAYGTKVSALFGLPAERLAQVPLAYDFTGNERPPVQPRTPFTVGYFARLAPEKGLATLVAALIELRARQSAFRLVMGGYLAPHWQPWFEQLTRQLTAAHVEWTYAGSPASRAEKDQILQSFDLSSVPVELDEPKGLYVLEAWAHGIPVVMPRRGALTELLTQVPGGLLVTPGQPSELADAIARVMADQRLHQQLASAGHRGVREFHAAEHVAGELVTLLNSLG